jgi:hypothetical protein
MQVIINEYFGEILLEHLLLSVMYLFEFELQQLEVEHQQPLIYINLLEQLVID